MIESAKRSRVRPEDDASVRAEAAVDVVAPEPAKPAVKMLEVELVRKYVPHLCYEINEDGKTVPVKTPEGEYLEQSKVVVGEDKDKFGRPIPKYRDILTAHSEGTVLSLPKDEATRAIKLGVAKITDRSFGD